MVMQRRRFGGHAEFDTLASMKPWNAWFAVHGIDPAGVPLDGWVGRDESNRRVYVEMYEVDQCGRVSVDAARIIRVFQLESVPLPFPDTPTA